MDCPECGHRVSDKAYACPSCGTARVEKALMAPSLGAAKAAFAAEPACNPSVCANPGCPMAAGF